MISQLVNTYWYVIHIDDAQQTKRVGKTIKGCTWYSPVAEWQDPTLSRIPLYVTGNTDELHVSQENALNEAAAWSLSAAASGKFPEHGPKHSELSVKRAARAGQQLAGPYKLIYAGGTGDWKGFAEEYHLPWFYNAPSGKICQCCEAENSGHPYTPTPTASAAATAILPIAAATAIASTTIVPPPLLLLLWPIGLCRCKGACSLGIDKPDK